MEGSQGQDGTDREDAALLGAMLMGAMLGAGMAGEGDEEEEEEENQFMEEELESGAIMIGSHKGGAVQIEEIETRVGFVEPENSEELPSSPASRPLVQRQ